MIIIAKSFRQQLKKTKIGLNEINQGLNRVFNKNIFRHGDALLSNSFVPLKNCLAAKIRVGYKEKARLLALFLIINNIKMPFYIAKKKTTKNQALIFP